VNTVAKETRGTLPHFPDPKDPDQRIRMGCPLEGENLRYRYREVTGGDTPAAWDAADFTFGYRFEWTLADIMACAVCEAKGAADCRSVKGERYFMDMHRVRTRETHKPCFVMTKCGDILKRKERIRDGVVKYR
jgi:hypothetical protein